MNLRFLAFLALSISAQRAAEPSLEGAWKLPADEPRLKAGVGSEITAASCILCHSLDYISTQPRLTRDQWKAIVSKMQQKFGAPINPEKVDMLLGYLTQTYGR